MAGLNGIVDSVRSAANVRIYKYTALIKSASTTTQNKIFGALPTAKNSGAFLGVTIEHFFEPNFFVPQGTDPTTVTGTTPVIYNLQGKVVGIQITGEARFILSADGAVSQGDSLAVADAFGRVNNLTNLALSGTGIFVVGIAMNSASVTNDILIVKLDTGASRTP